MTVGRQTGDSAIAAAAARSSMRRLRGPEWAATIDQVWPAAPVADPTLRIEAYRSLFKRVPRESLARAICVFDPWGLWLRLANLDGPRLVFSKRELDGYRRRCEEALAREDALETIRSDLPIAYRAKLEKRYAFEAAQVCAGFRALQDDLVEFEQSVGRAGHKDKGNGGAAARRRSFFGPVVRALRDHDLEYWSWPALADLILESEDDWRNPPCPRLVELYSDRDLAEVLRQDQRRTQGAR